MESSEVAMYRGLGEVRNYGVAVLIALLILNGVTLWGLHWVEINELRNELIEYSQTLPTPDVTKGERTVNLPEDILVFPVKSGERVGFYEISLDRQDYLAYADPNKHFVLMKSETNIQEETRAFAFALLALYFGELVLLLGWWFFIRTKVREIFETT